jgi:hypothetical protein
MGQVLLVFPCQHHSTNALYSYFNHPQSKLYKRSLGKTHLTQNATVKAKGTAILVQAK